MHEYETKQLMDGTFLIGHQTPVRPLVDSILRSQAVKPRVLPLRQKDPLPISIPHREARIENEMAFRNFKSRFIKDNLLTQSVKLPGIYFFYNKKAGLKYCYYIGIADSLKRRMGEHITRRDYVLYSLAFPEKTREYLDEVLWFYGEKRQYKKYIDEYKRQTECLDSAMFDTIAWIASEELSFCAWDLIETHFIVKSQPCVNADKKYSVPDKHYESRYEEVREFFEDQVDRR